MCVCVYVYVYMVQRRPAPPPPKDGCSVLLLIVYPPCGLWWWGVWDVGDGWYVCMDGLMDGWMDVQNYTLLQYCYQ